VVAAHKSTDLVGMASSSASRICFLECDHLTMLDTYNLQLL